MYNVSGTHLRFIVLADNTAHFFWRIIAAVESHWQQSVWINQPEIWTLDLQPHMRFNIKLISAAYPSSVSNKN